MTGLSIEDHLPEKLTLDTEDWRDIPGFEGLYMVSSKGRVFSNAREVLKKNGVTMILGERFVRPRKNPGGYWVVTLSDGARPTHKQIHQLVALAFIGPCPAGLEVAHWDGNQLNNRIANLRYATPQENSDDRIRHGNSGKGEASPQAKLNSNAVRLIRTDSRSHTELAVIFGVSASAISAVRKMRTWRHIEVAA